VIDEGETHMAEVVMICRIAGAFLMTTTSELTVLRDDAARLLSRFIDSKLASERLSNTQLLRPREEDYARIFVEAVAATARENYERLWTNIPPIQGKATQSVVLAWICLSGHFAGPDGKRFPGGYQKILDRMKPDIPWVSWKFVAPGQVHGMAYDGLVRIDDRWVWFPKPWKFIAPNTVGLEYMTD
jgi:hypothetical protein